MTGKSQPVAAQEEQVEAEAPDDLEIMLAEEDLELLEEYEFYQWLELPHDVG